LWQTFNWDEKVPITHTTTFDTIPVLNKQQAHHFNFNWTLQGGVGPAAPSDARRRVGHREVQAGGGAPWRGPWSSTLGLGPGDAEAREAREREADARGANPLPQRHPRAGDGRAEVDAGGLPHRPRPILQTRVGARHQGYSRRLWGFVRAAEARARRVVNICLFSVVVSWVAQSIQFKMQRVHFDSEDK